MTNTELNLSQSLKESGKKLVQALNHLNKRYPGLIGELEGSRQPVHSVYGGAQLWKRSVPEKMGQLALRQLRIYAPDGDSLAQALGVQHSNSALNQKIYDRIVTKLQTEPIEDFRIDFEDGYGNRPDAEEDQQAKIAAEETAAGMSGGTLPPFIGIRIKPMTLELWQRSLRTLGLFVSTLLSKTANKLPDGFTVTLPKVTCSEQVRLLVSALRQLEQSHGLMEGSLGMELMLETTQSVIGMNGEVKIPELVDAAEGRCRGVHFGTYDYTACCDIVAEHQQMTNPVCDFAKHMMQVSLGGTGIWLSDGATNIMPVPPHKGEYLSDEQKEENLRVVHKAWKTAYDNCIHSLSSGYYQGWDLHPAQLIVRYAAVFRFFLEGYDSSCERLKNFVEKAAQATLVGDVFDDAATGQGLLNYFLRGLNCRALSEDEALATGLTADEIHGKSFLKILEKRKKM